MVQSVSNSPKKSAKTEQNKQNVPTNNSPNKSNLNNSKNLKKFGNQVGLDCNKRK